MRLSSGRACLGSMLPTASSSTSRVMWRAAVAIQRNLQTALLQVSAGGVVRDPAVHRQVRGLQAAVLSGQDTEIRTAAARICRAFWGGRPRWRTGLCLPPPHHPPSTLRTCVPCTCVPPRRSSKRWLAPGKAPASPARAGRSRPSRVRHPATPSSSPISCGSWAVGIRQRRFLRQHQQRRRDAMRHQRKTSRGAIAVAALTRRRQQQQQQQHPQVEDKGRRQRKR